MFQAFQANLISEQKPADFAFYIVHFIITKRFIFTDLLIYLFAIHVASEVNVFQR